MEKKMKGYIIKKSAPIDSSATLREMMTAERKCILWEWRAIGAPKEKHKEEKYYDTRECGTGRDAT